MADKVVNVRDRHVAVIGAGMGGLAAAIDLARAGHRVTVFERLQAPGGKLRAVAAGPVPIDAGPTVLTMPDVFESLFADSGAPLADRVAIRPARLLARHAWPDGSSLDLHADPARTRDAIGRFAGAGEARRFDRFVLRTERIRRTLDGPFMRAPKPTPSGLVRAAGLRDVARIAPFSTLAGFLARQFRDGRLRQLFGRYATYCGSSPYEAPATLALIAAVEQRGVGYVEGGMRRLAGAMAERAGELGAALRFGAAVERVELRGGRACGVVLEDGEVVDADAVLANADTDALARGLLGDAARRAAPVRPVDARSLSAVTWTMRATVGEASSDMRALIRHNVLFSADGRAEFDALRRGTSPPAPTLYLCAEDRRDGDERPPAEPERLLILANAPARGDDPSRFGPEELDRCEQTMRDRLRMAGIRLRTDDAPPIRTGPREWEALFPGTGGALYGTALRGALSPFRRPGSRSAIEGLYLAGGGVHPGPGVPMAALSGRLAASLIASDLCRSTSRSPTTATAGGMSTPCRPTRASD